MNSINRSLAVLSTALMLAACSESEVVGPVPLSVTEIVSYTDQVKPILDARCVSCHACYDAPCQLKLASYAGIARGGSKEKVYDPTRLTEAPLSRLYFDAKNVLEWRDKGFHTVLAQQSDADAADKQFSALLGMLDLKSKNPLPRQHPEIDLPLDDAASWQCASNQEEFDEYADDYPQRGMPYGLPGLSRDETKLLEQWVAAGSHNDGVVELTKTQQDWIQRWEGFLNQDTLRDQLVARYIYEHLFLASLYSANITPGRYFQLVRSSTPPGEKINLIATRRPYDDPAVARVYYRLRVNPETVVAKTHMPYLLDQQKLKNWKKWFYQVDYQVTALPSYDIESASNPFKTFAQLPPQARYQFMLNESNFIIKGFIKGPVCKGPTAVNVINEHFWVFFVDPKHQTGEAMERYLAKSKMLLDMPAEKQDTLNLFGAWDEFSEKEKQFLTLRKQYLAQYLNQDGILEADFIWDGDGDNGNAALTVFRHLDNASVHKGLNGQPPKTAWVIDYPLLERIHYLLVAGYDVYGNISHQLLSRIYMDFLRMEGESTFLAFLSQQQRQSLRAHWYREADQRIESFMALSDFEGQTESIVESELGSHKLALFNTFSDRIGSAMQTTYQLSSIKDESLTKAINKLQREASEAFIFLPEVTFIQVVSGAQSQYFSLIRNVGHLNNSSVLLENLYIAEEETTVSVVPGFIGPRPNAFMRIATTEFDTFAQQVRNLQSEDDYTKLMDNYGIRRSNPTFWTSYDEFLEGFKSISATDYGVLDLNKLENR